MTFDEYPPARLTYLSRADVMACLAPADVVEVVAATLRQHARGEVWLPDEAYLGWQTRTGASARSLAMPGGVRSPDGDTFGVKIINGSLANPDRNVARSQGLLVLFDPERAWPTVVMEAAYVSALRTAAVTAVAAQALARDLRTVAILGCGTLAKAHLAVLGESCPDLSAVRLYDILPGRSRDLARTIAATEELVHLRIEISSDAETCVRNAGLVVTATTTTEGYLRHKWFAPGAVVAHVSLDDLLPEVVTHADLLLVDDWRLVSGDRRRLLGRLFHAGELRGPAGQVAPGVAPSTTARAVDATLSDVLVGTHPGRRRDSDLIVCNPFGMSILDVAVGAHVTAMARERGAGTEVSM